MLHCPRTIARTIALFRIYFWPHVLSPALAADPTGDWKVADGVANIRVAQCNGNMWGAVAWEKTPGGKDKNNPDPAKQSRPTLGMPILIDMKKKAGVDAWEGQVYNAKDGQLYSSTIKPVGTDQLEIQGCVLGFLCGGETWTRVGPPISVKPRQQHGQGRCPKRLPSTGAAPLPRPPGTGPCASARRRPRVRRYRRARRAPTEGCARSAGRRPPAVSAADIGDICLLPDIARFAH